MTRPDASAEGMLSVTKRYGLSVVLVLSALLVTLLVRPETLVGPVFFLAVILSAWLGGVGPGLVAALLATLTTMDTFLTACTGLDALTHAIEAYASLGPSPLTDLHALQAMRLVSANLEKSLAEPLNLEYRTNMMLGGLEAGLGFSNASVGAVHAMSNDALF